MSEKVTENAYKALRMKLGLTREEVCSLIAEQQLGVLTTERLVRIENDLFQIHPEEVLLLSKAYKEPSLCNHYCAKECEIGKSYVPEVKISDLEKIILPMVASLNTMKKKQERLIEIAADGTIDDVELTDFVNIQKELEQISVTVEALQLWTEQMIATGKINLEKYEELKGE